MLWNLLTSFLRLTSLLSKVVILCKAVSYILRSLTLNRHSKVLWRHPANPPRALAQPLLSFSHKSPSRGWGGVSYALCPVPNPSNSLLLVHVSLALYYRRFRELLRLVSSKRGLCLCHGNCAAPGPDTEPCWKSKAHHCLVNKREMEEEIKREQEPRGIQVAMNIFIRFALYIARLRLLSYYVLGACSENYTGAGF